MAHWNITPGQTGDSTARCGRLNETSTTHSQYRAGAVNEGSGSTTQSKMPKSLSRPPPESFFVFVVGHCEEWPDGRDEQGDAAIYKEYLHFGVPPDQCCYVKDNDCTRDHCQEQLETFLQTHRQQRKQQRQRQRSGENPGNPEHENTVPSTLVVHYGGHGTAHGFATIGGTWTYRDFVKTVRDLFHGDRVVFLIDCCASGNIWRHLAWASENDQNENDDSIDTHTGPTPKEYALLATSQPYVAATADGEEWILTNSWIQLMRLGIRKDNDSDIDATTDTDADTDEWSLDRVISLLADRHVLESGDLFYAYRTGARSTVPWSWMPMPAHTARIWDETRGDTVPEWLRSETNNNDNDSNSNNNDHEGVCGPIPNAAAMPPFHECRVGDALAYKHPGGHPVDASGPRGYCVPPQWLHGRIVGLFERERELPVGTRSRAGSNISDDCYDYYDCNDYCRRHVLRIRVCYPSRDREPWEVEVPHASRRLVNQFWVAQTWMMPRAFVRTQVVLAQQAHSRYLDASVQPGTRVRMRVRARAGSASTSAPREGRVADWKDFAWNPLLLDCYRSGAASSSTSAPRALQITTRYDEYYWNELPVPIRDAATILGYTKLHWNEDIPIPADETEWEELNEAQREAVAALGYARQKAPVDNQNTTQGLYGDGDGNSKSESDTHNDEDIENDADADADAADTNTNAERGPETKSNTNTNTKSIAGALPEVGKMDVHAGPHVPVEWEDSDPSSSLVPLDQILFPEHRSNSEHTVNGSAAKNSPSTSLRKGKKPSLKSNIDGTDNDNGNDVEDNDDDKEQKEKEQDKEKEQRNSLIVALHSSGKSVGDAATIFGSTELCAYCPDDERFWDATPIDLQELRANESESHDSVLRLLATHFEYPAPGIYCPILYEDGEKRLIPVNHIYRRGCQPRPRSVQGDEPAPLADKDGTDGANTDPERNDTMTMRSNPLNPIPGPESIEEMERSLGKVLAKVSSWGEDFAEAASLLEAASTALLRPQSEATAVAIVGAVPPTNHRYYGDEDWTDLPEHVRAAARTLGYNQNIWESDGYISIDGTEWTDLTVDQKNALGIIGYTEVSWNAQNDEYDWDSDSDEDY